MKFWAGIGSRETPEEIQDMMTEIASYLEDIGYILRSGNAQGADQAFAKGVKRAAQIWLPWMEFNQWFSLSHSEHKYAVINPDDEDAYSSIEKYHPKPKSLGHAAIKLMARNFRQVIGRDNESNSEFVICWTKGGKPVGGTGQALRIASDHNIPIYNMFNLTVEQILNQIHKLNMLQ